MDAANGRHRNDAAPMEDVPAGTYSCVIANHVLPTWCPGNAGGAGGGGGGLGGGGLGGGPYCGATVDMPRPPQDRAF